MFIVVISSYCELLYTASLIQELLSGCETPGSIHNDAFMLASPAESSQSNLEASRQTTKPPRLTTRTNNSGGVQGGISNGGLINFRVGFKPPATIGQAQQTVDFTGKDGVLEAKGRHDRKSHLITALYQQYSDHLSQLASCLARSL